MDSSYVYLQNKTVPIPHSLTISSYSDDHQISNQDKATLDFILPNEGRTLFSIHQNLILANISSVLNPRSSIDAVVFSAGQDQSVSKVSIIDCVFLAPTIATQMTLFAHFTYLEIEFQKTYFIAQVTSLWNTRRKGRLDFERKNISKQNSSERVVFFKCSFLNFDFSESSQKNSEWYFWNNTFRNTNLVIQGEMGLVHYVENTFEDNSYVAQQNSDTFSQDQSDNKERSTKVVGCTFRNSMVQFINYSSSTDNELLISNSNFENSPVTASAYASESNLIFNVTVENTSFTGSSYYQSSSQLELTSTSTSTRVKATIQNCTFKNSIAGSIYSDGFSITIANTKFLNNSLNDDRYFTVTRAAALTIWASPYVYLFNCTFIDNVALSSFYNSIYIAMADSLEILLLRLSHVKIVSSKGDNERESSIILIKTSNYQHGTAEIHNSVVFCGLPNSNIYGNIKGYPGFVRLSCKECDGTEYNSQNKSHIEWDKFGNVKIRNSTCYSCPYADYCINGIRSKGNYWGYSNNSGYVTFIQCPPFYCCPRLKKCDSYNTCMSNRQGRLCGKCKANHSICLFGGAHNKCVETAACQEGRWFWILYTIFIVLALLTVLYYIDVFKRMTKICCCSLTHREGMTEQSIDSDSEESTMTSPLLMNRSDERSQNQQTSVTFSGTIKIAFFFYQTASIIRINASSKMEYHMPYIIDLLTSFFNVKIDIESTDSIDICPFQTQNVALIELFRLSVIFGIILLTIILLIVLNLYRLYRKNQHQTSSFAVRLKVTLIQLLVIGYASITTFCIQSVDCVHIEGESYIFNQAHLKCFQSWQIVIIFFIVIWVVPFPVVLYFGCKLLRSGKITPNKYLLMLMFPPLIPLYLIKSYCIDHPISQWTDQQKIERSSMLALLNEPFRESENKDGGVERTIWEPVLIIRRLILVVVTTLIRSPIMKLYPAGILLILFTVHDYIAKPFIEPILNFVQLISMSLLGTLVLFNMFWALSINIDILDSQQYYIFGKLLLILELCILLAPIFLMVIGFVGKIGKALYKPCLQKLD